MQPLHQLKERYSASKVVIEEKYLAVTRIAICLLVQYFSYNYKWQNSSNSVTHLSKHIKSQCCPHKLQKTEEMYWLTEKIHFQQVYFDNYDLMKHWRLPKTFFTVTYETIIATHTIMLTAAWRKLVLVQNHKVVKILATVMSYYAVFNWYYILSSTIVFNKFWGKV